MSKEKFPSFLPQLENYIQDSMKQDILYFQQAAVHNHTATMIEIGANLLSQTAEQTRKLTNVEAQVRLHVLLFPNIEKAGKENITANCTFFLSDFFWRSPDK